LEFEGFNLAQAPEQLPRNGGHHHRQRLSLFAELLKALRQAQLRLPGDLRTAGVAIAMLLAVLPDTLLRCTIVPGLGTLRVKIHRRRNWSRFARASFQDLASAIPVLGVKRLPPEIAPMPAFDP